MTKSDTSHRVAEEEEAATGPPVFCGGDTNDRADGRSTELLNGTTSSRSDPFDSTRDSDAQSLDKRVADLSKAVVEQEKAATLDQALSEFIFKMRGEISEGYEKLAAIQFLEDPRGQKKEALKELLRKKKEELQSVRDRHSNELCTEECLMELEKFHEEFKSEKEKILSGNF